MRGAADPGGDSHAGDAAAAEGTGVTRQITEVIQVPLTKTLKDGEVLHSKLSDIKSKILKTDLLIKGF